MGFMGFMGFVGFVAAYRQGSSESRTFRAEHLPKRHLRGLGFRV